MSDRASQLALLWESKNEGLPKLEAGRITGDPVPEIYTLECKPTHIFNQGETDRRPTGLHTTEPSTARMNM
jgi:hypothetical protein